MNAVEHFSARLSAEAARRLASLRVNRFAGGGEHVRRRDRDADEARAAIALRWAGDLCALLNAMTRGELAELASAIGVAADGRSPELRARLWQRGAALECAGVALPDSLQPRPVVLGGHLVVQAPPRGMHATATSWPRALPAAREVTPSPSDDEPETIEDLCAAAERAIGVRLGARGRDKGAWGTRAAALLGVIERGDGEPDWRGDVEIKTVSVAPEASGLWHVREDPAIAMASEPGASLAKLQRTLWLARADCDGDDATIIAWYLLEWDAHVARLVHRYLHTRPKGPRGTDQRGLYLHKRFFADAGLLAVLNGPAR